MLRITYIRIISIGYTKTKHEQYSRFDINTYFILNSFIGIDCKSKCSKHRTHRNVCFSDSSHYNPSRSSIFSTCVGIACYCHRMRLNISILHGPIVAKPLPPRGYRYPKFKPVVRLFRLLSARENCYNSMTSSLNDGLPCSLRLKGILVNKQLFSKVCK